MRFGHYFHRHVVPEWHSKYVDYNLLKQLAKDDSNAGEICARLQHSLTEADELVTRRLDTIEDSQSELCELFGLETFGISSPETICPFELTLLLEAFHEFYQDLQKIQWFVKVNTHAVDVILDKLARRLWNHEPDRFPDVFRKWHEGEKRWQAQIQSSMNAARDYIGSAEDGLQSRQNGYGKSLYLVRAFKPPFKPRPLSEDVTDQMIQAIQHGDFNSFVETIATGTFSETLESLAGDLLRYAVMFWPDQARAFLASLALHSSPEVFLVEHETLKWGILAMGRRQRMDSVEPAADFQRKHRSPAGVQQLCALLDACAGRRNDVLRTRDRFGRLPAHYAAIYDLDLSRGNVSRDYCSVFIPNTKTPVDGGGDGRHLETKQSCFDFEVLTVEDTEGTTPLHMAVVGNCRGTLDNIRSHWRDGALSSDEVVQKLVPIAMLNPKDITRNSLVALCGRGSGVGEILRVAAQVGDGECIREMNSKYQGALGLVEEDQWADSRGWTPLFHASALGHYETVKLLLELGFGETKTDRLGWTAKEHAALNGHLDVAALFKTSTLGGMMDGPLRVPARIEDNPSVEYLEGERIIVATLGSERVNEGVTEVSLPFCSSVYTSGGCQGLEYDLSISAEGESENHIIPLPLLEDHINTPFVFRVPAASEPKLEFRVWKRSVKTGPEQQGTLAGFGVALLDSNVRQFGPGRQSLIREQTIPIFDPRNLSAEGTVTFTYMVVDHFPHLQTPQEVDLVRKSLEPPVLVGHRGLGMNLKTHEYLQIGENTVESFLSAARLGASFVEFDVQVTKDHEAVLFHDFSLSQSGSDVPIHDLTLDQFMYAGNIQSPHGNPLSVLGPSQSRDGPGKKRSRSRSMGGHFEAGAIQIRDRMKHTVDFKLKGFKANTRGDFIQDSFATLKELLVRVPADVGFDIEIKYPRLHEAQDANVAPVAIDLNTFVDTALTALHEHAGPRRRIILSSFTPEICMLLAIKQRAYPVFFITNAGKAPMIDMERRAASVQVAVRFARRWKLAGVVFACEALLLCPRLVGYVKNRGLVCASYGTLNNVPENVRVQTEAGVDVIIADRVGLIARTLAAAVPGAELSDGASVLRN